jgi:hypothetical protein
MSVRPLDHQFSRTHLLDLRRSSRLDGRAGHHSTSSTGAS